ncbi:hypothetical protein AKO1_009563 [Acrasis kona]|uniref:Amino acid transporter transmembrane domain-containing protein n=1 Tax=Acrasis kona TaxID=1008807 RepID=A0AAW2ZMT5_9EUKA
MVVPDGDDDIPNPHSPLRRSAEFNSYSDASDLEVHSITLEDESAENMEVFKIRTKKKKSHKDGVFMSMWNLLNDLLTPATIGSAYIITKTGLGLSLIFFPILGVITGLTLMTMYDLSKLYKKKSMPDLCELAFGSWGYFLACFFIFSFNSGGFIAQNLMVADLLTPMLQEITSTRSIWTNRTAVLCYFSILIIPISLRKQLHSFAITSMVSVCCILIIGFLCIIKLLSGSDGIPPHENTVLFARGDFYAAIGAISYCFVCHDLSIHVIDELKDNTRKRYSYVAYTSVALTIFGVFLVGVPCFIMFGDRNLEHANLLSLFPNNDFIAHICKFVFLLDLFLTVPYACIMPRSAVTSLATHFFPSLQTDARKFNIFFYCSTISLIVVALIISILVNNMGLVFEVAGGISACAIGFVIPPILSIKLSQGPFLSRSTVVNIGIVITGVSIWICSITNIIIQIKS